MLQLAFVRLRIFYLNPSFIPKNIKIKISCNRIDMVCTTIYSFLAPEGKYMEPATSLHPIEAGGMRFSQISYPWLES
jgi:hypothetical protein